MSLNFNLQGVPKTANYRVLQNGSLGEPLGSLGEPLGILGEPLGSLSKPLGSLG